MSPATLSAYAVLAVAFGMRGVVSYAPGQVCASAEAGEYECPAGCGGGEQCKGCQLYQWSNAGQCNEEWGGCDNNCQQCTACDGCKNDASLHCNNQDKIVQRFCHDAYFPIGNGNDFTLSCQRKTCGNPTNSENDAVTCDTGYTAKDVTTQCTNCDGGTGAECCSDTDGCSGIDCGIGGVCVDVTAPSTGYNCVAATGYTATTVNNGPVNNAAALTCTNGDVVIDGESAVCTCTTGYSGGGAYTGSFAPCTATAISSSSSTAAVTSTIGHTQHHQPLLGKCEQLCDPTEFKACVADSAFAKANAIALAAEAVTGETCCEQLGALMEADCKDSPAACAGHVYNDIDAKYKCGECLCT